jgi:ABC-type branched-subunit amino acid transport system ATPase component
MTTLAVRDLDVYIQASHILRNVTLEVGPEEVVCLVGRNGAGKTTLLRTVMGYLRPRAGTIVFKGAPIHGRPTHAIALGGIGFAPEDSGIFADLTVAENIEIATWTRPGGRPARERVEAAYGVFPVLRTYAARKGPAMSGGERCPSRARSRWTRSSCCSTSPSRASPPPSSPRWRRVSAPSRGGAMPSSSPSRTSTTCRISRRAST